MSTSKSQQKLSNRYSSSQVNGSSSRRTRGNGKSIVLIVSIVLAIIAIIVITTLLSSGKELGGKSNSYNLVVQPDNIEELKAANPVKVAPGSYDVNMNSTWNFKNARSSSSNAYVSNMLSNTNTVRFTVTRNDTGSTIYESPYIPVGSSLSNIKLSDESLQEGTYPCVITYHLVDDEYKDISSVKINITVVIEND